jgi:glutamate dehydrogenase (NAD(P)+)
MMGWMMDEYSKLVGQYTPGVITGKPLGGGGSQGRTAATGFGVVVTIREALKHLNIDGTKTTCAIQGFGNVAQYAAITYLSMIGGKVVCVSCWDNHDKKSYTFSKESGIDPKYLQSITDQYGSVDKGKAKEAGYLIEDGAAWIAKDVDILMPAAIEGVIDQDTVKKVSTKVKIVVEGANGPTTPEADALFRERNVFLIPDFLANAGGVTCSYFESVQNDMNYYWSEDEVISKLDQKMSMAFKNVLDMSVARQVYMRNAAYMVAIDSVVRAMQLRGWL